MGDISRSKSLMDQMMRAIWQQMLEPICHAVPCGKSGGVDSSVLRTTWIVGADVFRQTQHGEGTTIHHGKIGGSGNE
ncbi:hypothetical protein [Polycladomyces abyssicola]|uniref:hypothetical protein n=1 Tax=Polycladomyces abyssicola TaxID=1125966 RepID=UPI001BB2E312|nr:hypothetical protein [Polycladomyces abyssicola]